MKKLLTLLLSAAMVLSFAGCTTTTTPPETPTQEGVYTPGTYTGAGMGMNGDIKVEVSFDANKLTAIKVLEHIETAGIGDVPLERIPQQVLENQSLKIESVASATFTSLGVLAAIEDCVVQAGGDAEALKAVEPQTGQAGQLVEETAEVVIVGGGGAGLAAAVCAAQHGAKSVLVIEKTAALGGNAVRSGGYYSNPNPEVAQRMPKQAGHDEEIERILALEPKNAAMKQWQDTLKVDYDAYKASGATYMFDSAEFATLQYYEESEYTAKPELLYEMCKQSTPVFDWIAEQGLPWQETSFSIVGSMWPRWNMSTAHLSGIGFVEVFENTIKSNNLPVKFVFEVAGKELITAGEKVVGVTGIGVDGTPYKFNATNGVIIATGGFSANVEMRQEYNTMWDDLGPQIPTSNSPAMTGDGIVMAQAVGANLVDMGKIQLLPVSDPETGSTSTHVGDTTGLYVNKEGLRFVDESGTRDQLSGAILQQTDNIAYVISSQQNSLLDEQNRNPKGIPVDDLIAQGKVFRGETIEALAAQIGMNPAVLKATTDQFNEAAATGNDPLLGRTRFNEKAAIEVGPFYACPRSPAVHITKGGIDVDVQAHVLNTEGKVIQGLYSAGEVCGGRFRNGLLEAFTTGYTAGENAAQGK